jgi:hypothetical protein
MKRTLIAMCLALALLTGCSTGRPQQSVIINGWQVEKCFEKDGYTVYRFSDGQQGWRYYVVPKGEMIDEVRHGKSTIPESVRTVKD